MHYKNYIMVGIILSSIAVGYWYFYQQSNQNVQIQSTNNNGIKKNSRNRTTSMTSSSIVSCDGDTMSCPAGTTAYIRPRGCICV